MYMYQENSIADTKISSLSLLVLVILAISRDVKFRLGYVVVECVVRIGLKVCEKDFLLTKKGETDALADRYQANSIPFYRSCACCSPMFSLCSSSRRWLERPHLPTACTPPQSGGASRPSVIERCWSAWWGGCEGDDTSPRMPPHLLKWWNLLKSGCLEQSNLVSMNLSF